MNTQQITSVVAGLEAYIAELQTASNSLKAILKREGVSINTAPVVREEDAPKASKPAAKKARATADSPKAKLKLDDLRAQIATLEGSFTRRDVAKVMRLPMEHSLIKNGIARLVTLGELEAMGTTTNRTFRRVKKAATTEPRPGYELKHSGNQMMDAIMECSGSLPFTFDRNQLQAELKHQFPEVVAKAAPGALADAITRLRDNGKMRLVSAPSATSPATYSFHPAE